MDTRTSPARGRNTAPGRIDPGPARSEPNRRPPPRGTGRVRDRGQGRSHSGVGGVDGGPAGRAVPRYRREPVSIRTLVPPFVAIDRGNTSSKSLSLLRSELGDFRVGVRGGGGRFRSFGDPPGASVAPAWPRDFLRARFQTADARGSPRTNPHPFTPQRWGRPLRERRRRDPARIHQPGPSPIGTSLIPT